jgi:DnaJ-class molecular chaperone
LGLQKTASAEQVKQSFLKLALKHHPDTSPDSTTESGETFWRIRAAFEAIHKNGATAVTGDSTGKWKDNSSEDAAALANWFHEETGLQFNFHMTAATKRELAHVAKTMSPGGLDRGGMWEMARRVAQEEISGEDPLQVTGSMKTNSTTTTTTQPRRRRRK